MTALAQTLSTIRHSPGRTVLTALGTALGIATIVALLAVGSGVQRTVGQLLHLGASDLALFQKDAADPTTSVLPLSLVPSVQRAPGIAEATPLLLLTAAIHRAPNAVLYGAAPDGFEAQRLVITRGRLFRGGREIDVGDTLASQLHLKPGATLAVAHTKLTVVGTYHIGITYEDSGAFMPLPTAQALASRQGETTLIAVELAAGARSSTVQRMITSRFAGVSVIGTPQEAAREGANGQLIANASLVIAALALIIGGIGVMNTMLMSVIERRSEFALLSAVGWSGPQIATRVLAESLATTILGAALGLLVGILGAHLLVDALGAQTFVSPRVTGWDVGRALLVGVLLGVLGGLYPAWRAAHVSPALLLAQQ